MKRGSPFLLVAAAAVLALIGALLIVLPGDDDRRSTSKTQPSDPAAPAAPPPATPAAPPPTPADPVEEPDAPPERKAPSDQSIQKGLEASWPGAPPTGQEKELVALGWALVRADLTGRGREKWPEYFPGEPSRSRYTRLRMRAAVARQITDHADLANVIVIWTGTDPGGRKIPQEQTVLCLSRDGARWRPVLPPACAVPR